MVVLDTATLQFALNLEFIEATFYGQGLELFNDTDFQNAGFDSSVRGRFNQIWEHELTHVAVLQSLLGANASQPCNYSL